MIVILLLVIWPFPLNGFGQPAYSDLTGTYALIDKVVLEPSC